MEIVSNYVIRKMFKWAIDRDMPPVYMLGVKDIMKGFDEEWITGELFIDTLHHLQEYFGLDVLTMSISINEQTYYDSMQIGLMRILPISLTAKFLTKHIKNSVNKNIVMVLPYYNENEMKIIIEASIIDVHQYSKDFCDYHKGAIIGIMKTKGYCDITIEETECVCNGDNRCVYIIRWKSKTDRPYFKTLKDLIILFFGKNSKIPDYVIENMKKQPETLEDLQELL